MKIKASFAFVLVFGALVLSAPLLAHHGSAGYEAGPDKMIQSKATVTDYVYGFPHTLVYMDTKEENGTVKKWVLEAPPPSLILQGGPWTGHTLKAGDVVTVYFHPCKNNKGCGILRKVTLPNGQTIAAWRQYVDSGTLQPPQTKTEE